MDTVVAPPSRPMGFWLWLARECVRANPLYVISAAFCAYGVLQLNTEIDPEIGKLNGIVLSLVLLHLYEIAIVSVATIVLRRRNSRGGGDLHGLTIVAVLFLCGAFLALDELIALFPQYGPLLVCGALLLAWAKLEWYARLPGIFLPRRYRLAMLTITAAHSLAPLFGHPILATQLSMAMTQQLAWLCGWLSLLVCVGLAIKDRATVFPSARDVDVLASRRCPFVGVAISAACGFVHLYSADWVFDRPHQPALRMPFVLILILFTAQIVWLYWPKVTQRTLLLWSVPAVLLWQLAPWRMLGAELNMATVSSPAGQAVAAYALFYGVMLYFTRQLLLVAGLIVPVLAVTGTFMWKEAQKLPAFRALLAAALAFGSLLGGMVISLYRDRLLALIDRRAPIPAAAPSESLP